MKTTDNEPRAVYRRAGGLGEAPLWDPRRHRLLQKDGRLIVSIDLASGETKTQALDNEPGTIALTAEGDLLAACGQTVFLLKENGVMTPLHAPARLLARQFNDGKAGPDGRFYVGTIYGGEPGGLYCLESGLGLALLHRGLAMSNGMDWSPDGRAMYLADTQKREIIRFDFDPSRGFLGGGRVLTVIPEGMGGPDGLCVDAAGHIWCALCSGGRVVRISPADGKLLREVRFPTAEVTSCVFAGEDLSLLAVTSADFGSHAPLAGFTFTIDVGVCGREPNRYRV